MERRFLPATKSMPKEMLPVVDRPVVQYAVDEAFEAGIEHIVFVTGRNKAVIEDYFDLHPELVGTLEQTGKKAQLQSLERLLPVAGATSFIRQQSPQGLGHAVWCARDMIGDEPFALLLPDMVSFGGRGCLAEVTDLYERTGGNVIAVEHCDPSETSKYGIVGSGAEVGTGFEVTAMVEKPAPANAPSNYYINGRYILQPEIFALLGNAGARRRQRDPADGRHGPSGAEPGLLRPAFQRTHVRLRLQRRVHPGQCRVRVGARRYEGSRFRDASGVRAVA